MIQYTIHYGKGILSMSITLKQLYGQTHIKYQLNILAGAKYMSNIVSRIYYIDDINIADWTRPGELIMTMGSTHGNEDWLYELISHILPHEPSGIVVNTGGYIHEIPQDIIAYCEENNLPLLTFPWEVFQQDVIQDWTNRIFQADQLETGLSSALLNAIFEPANRDGYIPYLRQCKYKESESFVISILRLSEMNRSNSFKYKTPIVNLHTVFSEFICGLTERVSCILLDDIILMVFIDYDTVFVEKLLREYIDDIHKIFENIDFRIGIGNTVHGYDKLSESYNQAMLCVNYNKLSDSENKEKDDDISSITSLGVPGLLITCDSESIKQFYEMHLKHLKDYDIANETEYFITLRVFLANNCNVNDTASALFIHRNTVNYRIKHIQEFLGVQFDNSTVVTEFTIAFMIYDIMNV